MPRRNKIFLEVDKETRDELNKLLVGNGFSQYIQLSDWLAQKGLYNLKVFCTKVRS